ncbi:MAG: diguanylate cyclase [Pseudomonadota bacterium]|nr:diguanylate cyclase [Pseudomonadota bacterium]
MHQSNDCHILNKGLTLSVIMFAALILAAVSFFNEVKLIKDNAKSTIDGRVTHLTQHMHFMSATTASLKSIFEKEYLQTYEHPAQPFKSRDFISFPKYNLHSLEDKKAADVYGALHILDNLDPQDTDLQREIYSAFALDPIMDAILSQINTVAWVYYTSKQGMLYISPKHSIEEFQFNKQQFNKPFWTEAAPDKNPLHNPVVTEVYEDGAGQGMMLTLSNPIVIKKQFIGIVSVDITTQDLNRLLSIDNSLEASILIDENKVISSSINDKSVGKPLKLNNVNTQSKWEKTSNGWVYSAPIVDNEIYIVHLLSDQQILTEATQKSLPLWALLALGVLLSVFAIQLYCTSRKNLNLMLIDPLTSLYNRRGFSKISAPVFARLHRHDLCWSVLLIDIDCFKFINDNFGHAKGDDVLVAISKIIKTTNRQESIVSRWGGEEFLVLLPETDIEPAKEAAERMRKTIYETTLIKGLTPVSVSVGVAGGQADEDFEKVVHNADIALYEAKNKGRNTTVIYSEPKTEKSSNE